MIRVLALCLRRMAFTLLLCGSLAAQAEDGSAAWLRFVPVKDPALYASIPSRIAVRGEEPLDQQAGQELAKDLGKMLGRPFSVERFSGNPLAPHDVILLDSTAGLLHGGMAAEAYRIRTGPGRLVLTAGSPRGELYGVFHLLELVGTGQPVPRNEEQAPAAPIRWTDEWDNLNGTIERGYAGPSIFFAGGHVRADLTRAGQYARLLASVGINGCNVNNVNADLDLLTTAHLQEFARLAQEFRAWGVRLSLSVDLTSPQTVGGLPTFDPLDPAVIAWWKHKVDEIYQIIPDFGGFTVKADSEGRKGPSQYGRSPADAANVLARALKPHGGVVLYRGFVYNNHLDWRDPRADRARAGVDNFVRYDGLFDQNVIVQIKEGPIDFQAREPVSPLFGALHHTAMAIEVQTSQEYTGQQRHMVWLPSMWKEVLDTDLHAPGPDGAARSTPLREIVEGKSFPQPDGQPRLGGFISVTNVGLEVNWLHHPMAMANLYGFGKLAWNPQQSLDTILDTWTRLTWGNDPTVVSTVTALQLHSWNVYEGYTGPNGMGTLTNILGYHFGPGIESAERNGWGQWFKGDHEGIGMDRTSHGTGFAQQYPPALAARYESLATCPPDLLLFFHHVPYTYRLPGGKTLIQSVYDTHYASALAAARYVPAWESLKGKIDEERYNQVLALFEFQAGHALVWRDAIDTWFQGISGIADAEGRVGHDPGRIEAENMQLDGYTTVDVTPAETASGGKAVVCERTAGCSLTTAVQQPAGVYDVAVQYFDTWGGASRYTLQVNGRSVAQWAASDTLPPAQFDPHLDGQDSTRYTARGISLHRGDHLVLRGLPDLRPELAPQAEVAVAPGAIDPAARERRDLRERAPVDYLVIGPNGAVTPQ